MEQPIKESISKLVEAIKSSEDYIRSAECRKELEQQPEIWQRLNMFRLRNFELQNSDNSDDLFTVIDEMTREYDELCENPIVSDFLACELSICRMVQNINYEITSTIDIGITDFLDDISL